MAEQQPANAEELTALLAGLRQHLSQQIELAQTDLKRVDGLAAIATTTLETLGSSVDWPTFLGFMMSQISPIQLRVAGESQIIIPPTTLAEKKKEKKSSGDGPKRLYATALGYEVVVKSLGTKRQEYPITFEEAVLLAYGDLASPLHMAGRGHGPPPLVWQDLVLGTDGRLWVNVSATMEIMLKLYALYGRDNSGTYPEAVEQTAALHRKLAFYHEEAAIQTFFELWQQSLPAMVERLLVAYESELENVPFPQRMAHNRPRWARPA